MTVYGVYCSYEIDGFCRAETLLKVFATKEDAENYIKEYEETNEDEIVDGEHYEVRELDVL